MVDDGPPEQRLSDSAASTASMEVPSFMATPTRANRRNDANRVELRVDAEREVHREGERGAITKDEGRGSRTHCCEDSGSEIAHKTRLAARQEGHPAATDVGAVGVPSAFDCWR